jgi:DNA-binding transcriptional ArsR family regulator
MNSGGVVIKKKRAQGPFSINYGPYVVDGRISDSAARTLDLLDILCGADEEGCHSCRLIADLRHTSVRTIERHLAELKDVGLVAIEYRQGQTNVITILDPVDVYGDEAIRHFYKMYVRRQKETPDKNDGGTHDKNDGGTPDKNDVQNRGRKNRGKGTELFEAASSSTTPQRGSTPLNFGEGAAEPGREDALGAELAKIASEAPRIRQDDGTHQGGPEAHEGGQPLQPAQAQAGSCPASDPGAPQETPTPPQTVCKPFTSSRSGCGIIIPGEDPEEEGRFKRKRKKLGGDTEKNPNEWNCNDAAKYFSDRYKATWRGEGAPAWGVADLSALKGRIAWLKAESIGADMMKKVIDHLFAGWSDGLPARFKWGTRPTLSLLKDIRLFERLVREVQGGVGGTYKWVDEFRDKTPEDRAKNDKAKEKDAICAELIKGGMSLWDAEKEALKRTGLEM